MELKLLLRLVIKELKVSLLKKDVNFKKLLYKAILKKFLKQYFKEYFKILAE